MCFTAKVMQPILHNSGWEWPWLLRLWCVDSTMHCIALWSQGNYHCRPCSRWCLFIWRSVCLGTPCLLLRSIKVLYGGQQIFRRIHIRLMDCSQITSSKRGIHKKKLIAYVDPLFSCLISKVTGYKRKCHFFTTSSAVVGPVPVTREVIDLAPS